MSHEVLLTRLKRSSEYVRAQELLMVRSISANLWDVRRDGDVEEAVEAARAVLPKLLAQPRPYTRSCANNVELHTSNWKEETQ
jgi:hypothetical protein